MPSRRRLYCPLRSSLLAALAVLSSGCTILENRAMQCVVDSWVTTPIESVKASWGPPEKVQSVPEGTAYIWQAENLAPPAPHDIYPVFDAPRSTVCERRLITGTDGRVVAGTWNGEGCCFSTRLGRCAAWLRGSGAGSAA